MVHRAKARASAAEALRAKVEAEQAQRQNEIQIAELNGNLRELDTLAEMASLKQQIAGEPAENCARPARVWQWSWQRAGINAAAYAQSGATGAD